MKEKQFVIGDLCRGYLNALDLFQQFENTLLRTLIDEYGEDNGSEQYNNHVPLFDDVERVVMECLRYTITLEMGTDREIVTL